jgi:hypothetical protein
LLGYRRNNSSIKVDSIYSYVYNDGNSKFYEEGSILIRVSNSEQEQSESPAGYYKEKRASEMLPELNFARVSR